MISGKCIFSSVWGKGNNWGRGQLRVFQKLGGGGDLRPWIRSQVVTPNGCGDVTPVNLWSEQPRHMLMPGVYSHLLVTTEQFRRFHSLKCWVLHDSCSTMKTAALLCYLSLDAVIPTLKHKKLWKVRRSWYIKKKSSSCSQWLKPLSHLEPTFFQYDLLVYVVLFAHGLSLSFLLCCPICCQ